MIMIINNDLLKINNLFFERSGRCILKDINITGKKGELIIVKGANGSGKTTLLRLCAGLLDPTKGNLCVNQELITFIGHKNAIYEELSILDNLQWFAELAEVELNNQRCSDALKKLQLDKPLNTIAKTLSQGQKRKLSLLKLIVENKPIWIIDEPTVNLDFSAVAAFWQLVQEKILNNGLVIISTHQNIEELEQSLNLRGRVLCLGEN